MLEQVKTFGLLGINEYFACEKDRNLGGGVPGLGHLFELCPPPICMMVFGDGNFGEITGFR